MKVSVITLHNSQNYGSCLQSYATQQVFSKIGAECELVDYYRKDVVPENEVDRALNGQLAKKIPLLNIPVVKWLARIPVSNMVKRRAEPLNEFREGQLHLTKTKFYSVEKLESNPPEADIYCTGSDQVWNSEWNNGFERAFYLSYAPEGYKRIAYAASIGRSVLDDWEVPLMREALTKYDTITVREADAVDMLEAIDVHGAIPVIDPTLMLNKNEWQMISDGNVESEPYILIYQLNRNKDFDRYVQDISRMTGLRAVRIAYGVHERRHRETTIICPSLGRFLSLFIGAELVVTDSFHATAFSINFGRRFIAVSPGRFGGRITSLLGLTGLENRILTDYRDKSIVHESVDFEEAHIAIDGERTRCLEVLRKMLIS